jgi:hypothetical protein
LVAQSLWTQTFLNTGTEPVDINLHLHLPVLQVQLFGVPPRQTVISATETAQATAELTTTITHSDLTQIDGSKFEYGLRLSEIQFPSGKDLLNLASLSVLGQTGGVAKSLDFNGDDFNPAYTLGSVSTDLDLGTVAPGDILSYVYTLTAQGTTHGFERGYDAFIGDPFGADAFSDNLNVTITAAGTSTPPVIAPADVPELSSFSLLLLGFTGLFVRHWLKLLAVNPPGSRKTS